MGRKNKRQVYDPTIVSRLADDPDGDDLLYDDDGGSFNGFGGANNPNHRLDDIDGYIHNSNIEERQETQEILDPKLHSLPRMAPNSSYEIQRRRKKCLWITFATALAMLIAVIVTIAVVTSKNKDSSSASQSEQQQPPKKGQIVLPPPPTGLASSCTDLVKNLGGDVAYHDLDACREACQVAKCCNLPSQFAGSCLQENIDNCLQYHSQCYVLSMVSKSGNNDTADPFAEGLHSASLTITVPTAPSNLSDVCATNSLVTNTGVHDCAELCEPYSCCYESKVASCIDQTNCAQYGPCLNLKAHDAVAPTIEEEVKAACDPTQISASVEKRNACNNACKLARCCASQHGCYLKENDGFCVQYEACSILWLQDKQSGSGLGSQSQPTQKPATMVGDDGYGDDAGTGTDDAYYDDDDFLDDDNGENKADDNDDLFQTMKDDQWADDDTQNWDDTANSTTNPQQPGGTTTTTTDDTYYDDADDGTKNATSTKDDAYYDDAYYDDKSPT